MSIAPANRASTAAGPALNVFHSTFTPGPIAFSKNPFALPTIAWECVMFGNAPTRMVVAPCAQLVSAHATHGINSARIRLLTFLPAHNHAQHSRFLLLWSTLLFGALARARRTRDQICQGRVLENLGRGVAYIQKYLVQRPVGLIAVNQHPQLLGIAKRSQRAVNQADDLGQPDVGWFTAQLVSALGAAHALHQARVLEFEQNQFQELLRQIFL